MSSFVKRPQPPTVEIGIKRNKKNLEVLVEVKGTLADRYKSMIVDHIREEIRKSLKRFKGKIFRCTTYTEHLEMQLVFSNSKKAKKWLKHTYKTKLLDGKAWRERLF